MSIQNKIHLTCGVFLWLLAMPLIAMAADFTFNVPVNIQNQNAGIDNGEVLCSIYRERQILRQTQIGEGVQFFTLDSLGNFQGTLTVAIFADEDPTDARSYACVLRLQETNGNFIEQSGPSARGNFTAQGDFAQSGQNP